MNICVFGSSSDSIDRQYLDSAESLGSAIAEKGHTMIYGAGKYGIMGAAARGVLKNKGRMIGVVPKFFIGMEVIFDKSTETVLTETMRERKAIMEEKADVFVICAGGMGTFEEFFEVLTLKQLHRHSKPIIVYNVNGYYNPMLDMMQNAVDKHFMTDECNRLYTVAQTEAEIFEQIKGYVPFSYDKYNFLNDDPEGKNG